MIDDLKRQQEIDAFQLESVSTGWCLFLVGLCVVAGLVLDAIERRAPAAPVVASVPRATIPLSHPLCQGREQILKQWGGSDVSVNACVNADLRARK